MNLATRQSSFAWKWKMPVSPEVVGNELGKIEEEYGQVTPAIVVEVAQSGSNPMHPLFTWDDSIAGKKYRLTEAQYVLRNLVIRRDAESASDEAPRYRSIRAFLSVPQDEIIEAPEDGDEEMPQQRMVYLSAQMALSDPQKRAYILDEARRALSAWRNRYDALSEFADLFVAIDDTLRKFTNEVKVN